MTDHPDPHPGSPVPGEPADPAEAVLRRALADEAARLGPADPGALDRILVAGRRRLLRHRAVRVGGGLLAAAALVAAAVAVPRLVSDDTREVTVTGPTTTAVDTTTAPSTAPTTTPTSGPTTAPPTTTSEAPPAADTTLAAVWPYRSDADADRGGDPTLVEASRSPRTVAAAFVERFLEAGPPAEIGEYRAADARSGEVDVRMRPGGPVSTLVVRQLGATGRWSVVAAFTANITIDAPGAFAPAEGTVDVAGTSTAFEGTVVVDVRETPTGQLLGRRPLIGGANGELGPYRGAVGFLRTPAGTGAVVVHTESAADGRLEEFAVVGISWPVPAPPGAAPASTPIAAVTADNRLVTIDPRTGTITRVLVDEPAAGAVGDVALADGEVWFTRVEGASACAWSVWRVPLAAGEPELVADLARTPAVRGAVTAWVTDADCDRRDEIVLRDATGATRVIPPFDGDPSLTIGVVRLTWWDDRWLVAEGWLEDGSFIQMIDTTDPGERVGAGYMVPTGGGSELRSPDATFLGGLPALAAARAGFAERCGQPVDYLNPWTGEVLGSNDVGPTPTVRHDPAGTLAWLTCQDPPVLMRLEASEPRHLADGIVSFDW